VYKIKVELDVMPLITNLNVTIIISFPSLCISTNPDGTSCDEPQYHKFIPYCKKCVENGDPSLEKVDHPRKE
jgi:hypothetical protein